MFSSIALCQEGNPNKLPPCPKPDYSKRYDLGNVGGELSGRTEKWHNCWGRYVIKLSDGFKGDVLEGEWQNSRLHGYGTYYYLANNDFKGDRYVGEFKNGKSHGEGTYYYLANNRFKGDVFIGAYRDGDKNGLGIYTRSNGDKYMGEWKKGKKSGQGIWTTASGIKYEGVWENDNFIREATVNFLNQSNSASDYALLKNPNNLPPCPKPDYSKKTEIERTAKWTRCWGSIKAELDTPFKGSFHEGEWLNGVPHGLGTYTFANGDKYVGEWKDGMRNGQGTNTFANGDKYVGEWKDAKYHGLGTATFANGEKYVGEWKDDKYHGQGTATFANGDKYVGEYKDGKSNGHGTYTFAGGDKYVGEYKDDKEHGLGTYTFANGGKYIGEFKDDKYHGQGIGTTADGKRFEGIWENGNFIREAKVNLPTLNNNIATNTDRSDIDRERQQLAEDRRRLEDEKRQRQQASSSQRINLQINHTQPNSDGLFFIDIKTNADTASLLIDGKEEGGKSDGNYTLKRIARAGQSSSFIIVATDIYGNTDTKTINVTRTISEAKATYADLNPTNIKRRSDRDAVAIIIGISDYKNLPKADFANDDARVFYDYAIRALSIKPDNIKLLVDSDASEVGIYKAFKTWLPSKVRSSTDIYVFYSGHGLPTSDGKGLYLLPQQTDRDLISKTAIQMQEVISDIQSTKPKSVTLFLDACYSGQSRTGETLIASARPISVKSESRIFPENFTVITASQNDQISSSNPDLKHGIFSYYLMRGMEGDADTDKDGKITLGEMQSYLVENVGRQAGMMNRKQEPQLIGDANRVLVGR